MDLNDTLKVYFYSNNQYLMYIVSVWLTYNFEQHNPIFKERKKKEVETLRL